MLRDRLEFTQSELADAKNRLSETEAMQAKSTGTLQTSSIQIGILGGFLLQPPPPPAASHASQPRFTFEYAGEKVHSLSTVLQKQQASNCDVLVENADLKQKYILHVF